MGSESFGEPFGALKPQVGWDANRDSEVIGG